MTAFISNTFSIYDNPEFKELKNIYSKLDNYIKCLNNAEINLEGGLSFNNFIDEYGTKSIWAMNTPTINLFTKFLKSVNFYNNISGFSIEPLHIRGAKFITVNPKSTLNNSFNVDVKPFSNLIDLNTNLITITFPLTECNLILESKEETYNFRQEEMIVWDASKFEYRIKKLEDTQEKQVLVSIYLSIDDILYKTVLDDSLFQQGNLYLTRSRI